MNQETNTDSNMEDSIQEGDQTGLEPLILPYSKIIENQATLNIITLGHVAHGKSTLVRDITGVRTQKHKSELERNITIFLGYANAKIWQCPETGLLVATPSHAKPPTNPKNGKTMRLRKHISFTDCPGHETLMSTMISGTHNIDIMFLLVAGNDQVIPQPQTYEHLLAISAIKEKLDNLIILQNKLDLIDREAALANLQKIQEFIKCSPAEDAPIIPISAQMKTNMEPIYEYLIKEVPATFKKADDYNKPARLTIIRSFNVNKPSAKLQEIKGGVVGGSLTVGNLQIGDFVEIRPGITGKNQAGELVCRPLISKVQSLFSERNSLEVAISGGLIGIGLNIDPGLTKNNRVVGQVLGHIGTLPGIYQGMTIKYRRINRLSKAKDKIPKKGERVKVCVHATETMATVTELISSSKGKSSKGKSKDDKKKLVVLKLDSPVCFDDSDHITILRQVENRWRLDGLAQIVEKTEIGNIIYPQGYEEYCQEFKARPIQIVDDLEKSEKDNEPWNLDYDSLLDNISFRSQEKVTINLPIPIVEKLNRQSVFVNFIEYCKCLDFYQGESESSIPSQLVLKPKKHLFKFIVDELGASCSLNGKEQMMISGKFYAKQIESILAKYIQEYLICRNCGMLNSFLYRQNQLTHQSCNYCNSLRTI